ncbi:MAG: DUF3365 domain-containing protein, partial [Bacteroidetes bacterium]|nr:DUF3365 domain-containing protein [Bacteroidota bacterium]
MDDAKKEAQPAKSIIKHTRIANFALLLVIIWTIVIILFAAWEIHQKKLTIRELVTQEARTHFNKDKAFRLWATSHGGVYVRATQKTQPNPYLKHVPERDITTPSGKKLTLMNPAYMLRQLMDEYSTLYEVKGRITSLKPFRPQNTPDEWERKALKAFENGVEEVFEFVNIDNKPYLRLIRPLITNEQCLKCHGYQGYKVGDVRGGVGVSVPMTSYLIQRDREIRQLMISHILIWLLGIGGIYSGFRGLKRRISERTQAETALRESDKKFRLLYNNSPDMYASVSPDDASIILCNKTLLEETGYSKEEIIGSPIFKMYHDDCMDDVKNTFQQFIETG